MGQPPPIPLPPGKPLAKESVSGFENSRNYTFNKDTKLSKMKDLAHFKMHLKLLIQTFAEF